MPKRNRHRERQRGAVSGAAKPATGVSVGQARSGQSAGERSNNGGAPPDGSSDVPLVGATLPVFDGEPDSPSPHVQASVGLVSSNLDAEILAQELLEPTRSRPLVLISTPAGHTAPWIDAEKILESVGGMAIVVVLATAGASWRLAELLPPGAQVYGGAGRVYPPDPSWSRKLDSIPIRFAYAEEDCERATTSLISDAMQAVHAIGKVEHPPGTVVATGEVRALYPSRAVVRLDRSDNLASVWQELTAAAVPIDRLVTTGQRVSGLLDPEHHRLDVRQMLVDGAESISHYSPGDIVLAEVVDVRVDRVRLALHPNVVVDVPQNRVSGNPLDRLTSLFTKGETVVARVATGDVADGGHDASALLRGLTLRLDDIDDDDHPVAAPALLVGGPPWLLPPVDPPCDLAGDLLALDARPQVSAISPLQQISNRASVPTVVPRGATQALSLTLDAARAEIVGLRRERDEARIRADNGDHELAGLRREVARLNVQNASLLTTVTTQRTQLRKQVQRGSKARRTPMPVTADDHQGNIVFCDPAQQFRHEVYLAWVERIPPGQKDELVLPEYEMGPRFLDSLELVHGVGRGKVAHVVMEVLTGLADRSDAREMHPLRTGPGGGDPPRIRADGATCWRVSLQRGTPQARRLHFWRIGSRVELVRVVLHDDFDA